MRRQCKDGDGKESDEMDEGEALDTAEAGISSATAVSAAPPRAIAPEHGTVRYEITRQRWQKDDGYGISVWDNQ